MKSVLVYIAGPVTKGDTSDNVVKAHQAAMALIRCGVPCICPHDTCFWGNSLLVNRAMGGPRHSFVPDVMKGVADWYGMDLMILARCDALLRLSGESEGADNEVARAKELGFPIFHSVEEAVAWANEREAERLEQSQSRSSSQEKPDGKEARQEAPKQAAPQ